MIIDIILLSKTRRYYVTFIVYFLVIMLINSCFASTEIENSNVIDLSQTHNFLSFGDLYSDGQENFLCVEVAPRQYSLWNPASDNLSSTGNGRCPIRSNLHLLNPSISLEIPSDSEPNDSNEENQKDTNIYLKFDNPTNHCGSNIRDYYKIKTGKYFEEFYVISKLKNVEIYKSESWCDGARGQNKLVRQIFDTPRDMEYLRLNKKWFLLYSYDKRFSKPIFMKINIDLSTYWSSDDDLFVVPKVTLDQIWKGTPQDIIGRYDGVLRAIGKN